MPAAADTPRLPAFLRLDAGAGWCLSANSTATRTDPRSGAVELELAGSHASPLVDASGAFGGLTLPTGVAIAPDYQVLVAHPEGRVILRAPNPALFVPGGEGAPGFAPLWPAPVLPEAGNACAPRAATPPGPHDLIRPRGLAFSRDGDLLLTDEGDETTPGRLIVYAWPSMAVRRVVVLDGRPWDVAVDRRGRIYVADAGQGRVRRFDRLWREQDWPGGRGQLHRPRHLAIEGGETVLALDHDPATGQGRLHRLTPLGAAELVEAAQVWRGRFPPPIRIEGAEIHIPGHDCPLHGTRLHNVALDRRGRLGEGPYLLYRAQQQRRLREGRLITEALDSGQFGFSWHRLALDMDLPAAAALVIQSFTAAHDMEPARIADLPESSWSPRVVLTPGMRPEMLLQSPPGRYLWLRIGLIGDGITGPTIRAIEVLGPRRSSLRFLPAPFHEDPVARDFLDRFLSYFDTIFAEVEHGIARFPGQLTPQGAPEGAFLAWLAGWFDIGFLAQWPDATRRAFLKQAMDLHRARGTIAGLKAVLRLHLNLSEPMPVLIEGFRLRNHAARRADLPGGTLRLGGVALPAMDSPAQAAHRFLLVVPESSVPTPEDRDRLRQLVDQFRPAHTAWELITARPGMRIGCQSTIGVDTLLGGYPSAPVGQARLGQSAQLHGRANALPRLGDAVLRGSMA